MLSTFIKPPFAIWIFVLSNFEWPFYTGFTVATTAPGVIFLLLNKLYSDQLRLCSLSFGINLHTAFLTITT